jgi:hypothetical protein
VDGSGLVTGVGLGTADIRATSEGQSAVAHLTVAIPRGDLRVTTSTTGQDQDADGYTVVVDESDSRPIGRNDTELFEDLEVRDHTVELTGVAANCAVAGQNPRTVSVPSGGTGETTFSVDCAPVTGDLEVKTSTTGQDQDPDGYTVVVDESDSRPIGRNDSELFEDLEARSYTVELTGLAVNCSVDGENPRTVTVEAGRTAHTTFDVSCARLIGDLRVRSSTSGPSQPFYYLVVVDGTDIRSMGTNDVVLFQGLSVGGHQVRLIDNASNCNVQGENPRIVNVLFDQVVETIFEVTCHKD